MRALHLLVPLLALASCSDDDTTPTEAVGTNATGRLTVVRNSTTRTAHTYDARGRATESETRFAFGGSIHDDRTYKVIRSYDSLDRVIREATQVRGGMTADDAVAYGYGTGGGIARVDANGAPVIAHLRRDALGRTEHKLYGNGVATELHYDPTTLRLDTIDSSKDSRSLQAIQLAWNDDGQLVKAVRTWTDGTGAARAFNVCGADTAAECTYDRQHRLAGSIEGAYKYDASGNLTEYAGRTLAYDDPRHVHAATSITAGNERPASAMTYDANGNMLARGARTFEWNGYNYPARILDGGTEVSRAWYGPDRSRTRKLETIAGASTETVYVANLEIRDGQLTRSYFAAGERVAELRPDGLLHFHHTDHLGSASLVTRTDGSVESRAGYLPFGREAPELAESSTGLFHTFTDKERDATGLLHYGARLYDPELGRFISADPFGIEPGEPASLDAYAYVLNNPLSITDPTGHFAWAPVILAAVAFGSSFIPNDLVRNVVSGIVTGGTAPFLEAMGRSSPWLGRIAGAALAFASAYNAGGDGWVSFEKPAEWIGVQGVRLGPGVAAGVAAASESIAVSFLPGNWSGIYNVAHSAFNDAQHQDPKKKYDQTLAGEINDHIGDAMVGTTADFAKSAADEKLRDAVKQSGTKSTRANPERAARRLASQKALTNSAKSFKNVGRAAFVVGVGIEIVTNGYDAIKAAQDPALSGAAKAEIIGNRVGATVGAISGGLAGSTVGAALGPAGAAIGGLLGAKLGSFIGGAVGGYVGGVVYNTISGR